MFSKNSKIDADQLALSFHKAFGTPVIILRPFNTYGPHQSTRMVIPTIITQLVAGMREIRLGSLHPTRDFSYVSNTASAFEAVLRSDARGRPRASEVAHLWADNSKL